MIFFQGTPLDQAAFVNELQLASPVPLLVSQDMETGAGMRLEGATVLPSAMSIAASRDPGLAYMAGRVTATEARAVGVRQALAPVADVNATAGQPGDRRSLIQRQAGPGRGDGGRLRARAAGRWRAGDRQAFPWSRGHQPGLPLQHACAGCGLCAG